MEILALNIAGTIKNIGDRRGKIELILSNGRKKDDYVLGKIRVLKDEEINLSKISHTEPDTDVIKNLKKYKTLIIREQGSQKEISKIKL